MARIRLDSATLDLVRPLSEWPKAEGATLPAIDWAEWARVGTLSMGGLARVAALVWYPIP